MKLGFRRKPSLSSLLLTVSVIIILNFMDGVSAAIRVNSSTHGYTNVVVGIGEDAAGGTTEDEAKLLINNLQELLTNASEFLHRATGNHLFFEEITVLLPQRFPDVAAAADGYATGEVYRMADVRVSNVGSPASMFTLQTGDCGESGEFIQLPIDTVLQLHNDSYSGLHAGHPVKEFVSQWARYRFGVFGEQDTSHFYFDPNLEEFMPAMCSNEVPNGTLLNPKTGFICLVDDLGLPLEDCTFIPDSVNNDAIISSLLFDTELPHVSEFCNETTHNAYAPTMQNIRCRGKSAWEVMAQHGDFFHNGDYSDKRGSSEFSAPKFRFVKSNPNTAIVIAIDFNILENKHLTDAILASLSKYVLFALPDNSTVEVTIVNESSHTVPIRSPVLTVANRVDFVQAVEYIFYNATLEFMLHENLNEDTFENWSNGVVMLVVATKGLTGRWTRLAGAHFLPVFLNIPPDESLAQTAHDSDGKVYMFLGDGWDLEADLDSAFYDSSRFWDSHEIIPIDSSRIRPGQTFSRNFVVDHEVQPFVKFVISVRSNDTAAVAGGRLSLMSPTTAYGKQDAVVFSTSGRSLVAFNVTNAQRGLWSFREICQGSQCGFDGVSEAFAVVPRTSSALTAYARLNVKTIERGVDMIKVPHLTVVLENVDDRAVSVVASVHPPGNRPSEVYQLVDDGFGADVVESDHVYSTYLPNVMTAGVYKVVPVVYGGDGLPCFVGEHRDCFQRYLVPLYYDVKHLSGGGDNRTDVVPPGRITDLSVVAVKYRPLETVVQLKWSAPGNNFDHGTVAGYELQYFSDWHHAREFTDGTNVTANMVVHGSLVPGPPKSKQVVAVKFTSGLLPGQNWYVFIGVRAYDAADNRGAPSNVVNVPLKHVTYSSTVATPTTEPRSATPTPAGRNVTLMPNATIETDNETEEHFEHLNAYDGVIASAILLVIAVVISAVVCIHMKFFSKRARSQRNFAYEEFSVGERIASRIES